MGDGDDLQIYHDGTHSYIANSTGNLYLNVPNFIQLGVSNGGEKYLTATENGSVDLYYDNTKKLETTTSGVAIHEDTDKVVRFTGAIGEIGDVTGFKHPTQQVILLQI